MKINILLLVTILTSLTSCSGQNTSQQVKVEDMVKGDTVKELGSNIMVAYQDKKNVYWFGSWETGVYRYDGKTLINYTTKHGLPNNRIDEIKEDKLGNIYFISCSPQSTIVKFNQQSFTTIIATQSNEWKLQSADLWFRNAY